MRPATPTKPAAIAPTTMDVLVPPVVDGLGVAEDAILLVRGRRLVSVIGGTLLEGRTTGMMVCR
jgi:hypothetical protein